MPKYKRFPTPYPGVYFIEGKALDGRPEKIFYVSYYRQGKRIEEKAGRQYRDAMTPARASQIRTRRLEGELPSNQERRERAKEQKWTIENLWAEYSAPLSKNTKSYITDFGRFKNYLKPTLGGKEPQGIAPIDVHRLKAKLSRTHKPQTVKHVLQVLQRLVNFGIKKGLCEGLSFKLEFPRVDNRKTEFLTPEQLQALKEAIEHFAWDTQAANFLRLAMLTGLRRGEIFKLQWRDVDFDRSFLTVRSPKGGVTQQIPLSQAALEVLAAHPRDAKSPFVFPGRGGRQRTRAPKTIELIRQRAGLPPDFRPLHGLRHNFASLLVSNGVDLYTVGRLLTHKSPQMTARYAHLSSATLRNAAEMLGGLLDQAADIKKKDKEKAG